MEETEEIIQESITWQNAPHIDPESIQRGVYLIHFDEKLDYKDAKKYGDSGHYLGCSENIFRRIGQHQNGVGSVMTKMAVERNINMQVVAIFPGDTYSVEAMLTGMGAHLFCPICRIAKEKRAEKYRAKKAAEKRARTEVLRKKNQAKKNKRLENSPFRKKDNGKFSLLR